MPSAEYQREWIKKNPDRPAVYKAKYKEANREKMNAASRQRRQNLTPAALEELRRKQREYMRAYKQCPLKAKKSRLKREYGLTPELYDKMYQEQKGVCAICFEPETRKTKAGSISPLSIDHNHITGKVRALLCHNCNAALGQLKEDTNRMLNMFTYVQIHTSPQCPF